jgi:hypothetical protein
MTEQLNRSHFVHSGIAERIIKKIDSEEYDVKESVVQNMVYGGGDGIADRLG